MRSSAVLLVGVVLALVATACSSSSEETTTTAEAAVTSTTAATTTTASTTTTTEATTTTASTTTATEATTTTTQPDDGGLTVTSPAYEEGGTIPAQYTCDGDDISPEYRIEGIPGEAASLVVVMDDPDAPVGVWDHWVLYDVPLTDVIEEGDATIGTDGINSWGELGYGGPCPPAGTPHRYFLTVYALNVVLDWPEGIDKEGLLTTVAPNIVGEGQLMGLYGR